jgi:hypothetical protein
VIRRDEFSLLLLGGQDDLATRYKPIHRVAARFPMVREYVLLPDDDTASDSAVITVLIDVGNTLRRKCGAPGRTMLLVRPDGYLALRHDEWTPERLQTELQKWLVPVESTVLEEP